jgi:hypothetical protein
MQVDFGFDNKIIKSIIDMYKNFYDSAKTKMDEIDLKHKSTIMIIESNLTNKALLKVEEEVIEKLYKREVITPKLYLKFKDEIEA